MQGWPLGVGGGGLIGADVAGGGAIAVAVEWAGDPALVGRGAGGRIAVVDRRAAAGERVGWRKAAVVREWQQQRISVLAIAGLGEVATRAALDVVAQRGDRDSGATGLA
ncbi:MAG TPA: hypothetical protein VFV93_11465 [Thermomicrobiales bacterium]|nr:hypothetical protein [Thermomicrobiales bacterium]